MIGKDQLMAAALLALAGLAPAVHAQEAPRAPSLGFSIAERAPGNRIDGPVYHRALAAFAAARHGDAAYARFLTPTAVALLTIVSDSGARRVPFTAATIRAASESCAGPFAFDEGADWVQLSWVCRADNIGPLAPLITFRESPELSLTIWFEGDHIKQIAAMEPLWIAGRRRLAMGAYEAMRGAR